MNKYLHKRKAVRFLMLKRMRKRSSNSNRLKMLRNFLSYTISAAGFSHVVKTKSQWHRIFWILILMSATATMILMTYRVLQEYFKYPKAWQSKTVPVNSLEFPAITVCSRFLIPLINAHEAKLDYMEDMKDYLNSVPSRRIPTRLRAKCHSNPLCSWNRFSERCDCNRDPCETLLCYTPKGSRTCICSKRLCDWNPAGCRSIKDNGEDTCICRIDFDYSPFTRNTTYYDREFNTSLLTNVSQPALKLIQILKSGATSDLNDLDLKLMPEIRIMDDFGISFDGLIISCNFGGFDCDLRKDFTTLYSPNYGKCYMFNYIGEQRGKDEPIKKLVKKAGRIYGLQLYLQTRRSNMLPLYARRLGARVTIHDPYSLPFSRESGFDLRHRDLHSLSIQSQQVNRLRPPFGRCGSGTVNATSSYQEKPYNQINCQRRCLNDHVFRRCKCYHRLFMSGTAIPTGMRACKPEEFSCFGEVLEQHYANKIQCNCPAPCTEKKYKVSISVGKINKNFFRLIKKVKTLKMIGGSLSAISSEKKEDVLGVLVFYQSMSIINITETSIYSWHFLIANIGGNLGLFLGLSIVTFVEVAEFLFDVAGKTFRRR